MDNLVANHQKSKPCSLITYSLRITAGFKESESARPRAAAEASLFLTAVCISLHVALFLAPLVAVLSALLSVTGATLQLGHVHTMSLLSSSTASLSHLVADARILAGPSPEAKVVVAVEEMAHLLAPARVLHASLGGAAGANRFLGVLPAFSTGAAASTLVAILNSGILLLTSPEKGMSVLALASSEAVLAPGRRIQHCPLAPLSRAGVQRSGRGAPVRRAASTRRDVLLARRSGDRRGMQQGGQWPRSSPRAPPGTPTTQAAAAVR
ncbi:hypothetical protein ACP70R_001090 [Stipagrostis hirtigluma subsp. patula]